MFRTIFCAPSLISQMEQGLKDHHFNQYIGYNEPALSSMIGTNSSKISFDWILLCH